VSPDAWEYMGVDQLHLSTLPWFRFWCLQRILRTSLLYAKGAQGRRMGNTWSNDQ